MDKIRIEDLQFRCIIGVNDHERHEKQDVVLNLCLHIDLRRAGQTDDIRDTLDYKELKLNIRDFVEDSQFLLIERLAEGVASICLQRDAVQKVDVRLDKPGALSHARTVAVEIERRRSAAQKPKRKTKYSHQEF